MQIQRFEVLKVDLVHPWSLASEKLSDCFSDFGPGSGRAIIMTTIMSSGHKNRGGEQVLPEG